MGRVQYNPQLISLARTLRKRGTKAEALLWQRLKGRLVKGHQFTRQKPIGNFIVDFYCSRLHLAIEVDGITHDEKLDIDAERQRFIEQQGIHVLRFLDEDVQRNMAGVISSIEEWIEDYEAGISLGSGK